MKIVSTSVKIHTGLPNFSHRATEVTVVADEDESLDIQDTVRYLSKQIRAAWETIPKAVVVEKEEEVFIEPDLTPPTPPKRRGRPPKNPTPEPVVEDEFVPVVTEVSPSRDAVDDILG